MHHVLDRNRVGIQKDCPEKGQQSKVFFPGAEKVTVKGHPDHLCHSAGNQVACHGNDTLSAESCQRKREVIIPGEDIKICGHLFQDFHHLRN